MSEADGVNNFRFSRFFRRSTIEVWPGAVRPDAGLFAICDHTQLGPDSARVLACHFPQQTAQSSKEETAQTSKETNFVKFKT